MRHLKKCNRGLLLFTGIMLIVILSEIISASVKHQDVSDLTTMMSTYLAGESELYIMPAEYRSVGTGLTDGVYYLAYDKAVDTLSPYYAAGSNGYKASASLIASMWKKQFTEGYLITSFHCNVISVSDVTVRGSSATAKVKYKVRYEGSTGFLSGVISDSETTTYREVFEQNVSFKKTDEGWMLASFGGVEMFYPYFDGSVLYD